MGDPFGFLDAVFNGGTGASSVQGNPPLQGFAPVSAWMLGQTFAGAGPIGAYLGAIYGAPGTNLPSHEWVNQQDARAAGRGSSSGYGNYGDDDILDLTGTASIGGRDGQSADARGANSNLAGGERVLERLERGNGGATPEGSGRIDEVRVLGTPRDRPASHDWFENLPTQPSTPYFGGENPIRYDPPPPRARGPVRPVVQKALPSLPPPDRPERAPLATEPFADPEAGRPTVPNPLRAESDWATDAGTPTQLLPWGSWNRPEATPAPRPERGLSQPIETAPVTRLPATPGERSFWDRGGTGLTTGLITASVGIAAVMWWNPVGWVAGVTAVLAIAGGVAGAAASAVELGASYGGITSSEQDDATDRAISAATGFSTIGGIAGGLGGILFADDPRVGFETGEAYGGFAEGAGAIAIGLPSFVRALPRIWRVIAPYGRGLLYAPVWASQGIVVGGGALRVPRRASPIRAPVADRVRRVEYLGTTPLLERSEPWARYQIDATGSRNEGVFRITNVNGESRIVLADRFKRRSSTILEAKYGDMGQMWDATREAHIIRQAENYIDITTVLGGRVGYYVSTERGALRLIQRFEFQFPNEFGSGQLWVDWVPWKRR